MSQRNATTHAVITGGTQGVGLAFAKRLAREGAPKIAICGRDDKHGPTAAAEVSKLGAECIFIPADVSIADDCHRLMDTAINKFGSINALVNSAALTTRGTLLDTSLELWEAHQNTNLRAPFLTIQRTVKHLLETGQPGSIVNVISVAAYCGAPFLVPYSISKGGLAILTKNVAATYSTKHIRCNGIMLGWTETPSEATIQKRFHGASDNWAEVGAANQPMGRLIQPDEVAGLAAYMLSPESGVMTGSLVHYDQGVLGEPGASWADVSGGDKG